jgi:hypothetical protein
MTGPDGRTITTTHNEFNPATGGFSSVPNVPSMGIPQHLQHLMPGTGPVVDVAEEDSYMHEPEVVEDEETMLRRVI